MGDLKKFADNTKVTIDQIIQSGNYNKKIVEALKTGDLSILNSLSETDRNNRNIMEPLLYAYYNARKSYAVFKYFGRNIQDDRTLRS